jgi:hypothetical protein
MFASQAKKLQKFAPPRLRKSSFWSMVWIVPAGKEGPCEAIFDLNFGLCFQVLNPAMFVLRNKVLRTVVK